MSTLGSLGVYAVRVNSGGVIRAPSGAFIKLAPKGTPDILACIKGRFVGIEVKTPSEHEKWTKNEDAQHETARKILKNGGLYYVVSNPADILRICS